MNEGESTTQQRHSLKDEGIDKGGVFVYSMPFHEAPVHTLPGWYKKDN